MRSGTSFFNGTVFRKNITRFAPLWAIYTAYLVVTILGSYSMLEGFSADDIAFLGMFTFSAQASTCSMLYAVLGAMLLFGDLYQTRMCNALHALPIRREAWFATNVITGLVFSLVPTLIASGLTIPMALKIRTQAPQVMGIPLNIFLLLNLQYLFYFGVATLAAMLSGKRFAQLCLSYLITYSLIILVLLIQWLYINRLYGIFLPWEQVIYLCPPLIFLIISILAPMDLQQLLGDLELDFLIMDPWGYLGVCAAIGVALLAVALVLYRRRKLESAGNFLAVKVAEPVFLVFFSLIVGCLLSLIPTLLDETVGLVFLAGGLVIGYYAGMMLVRRTVKVFKLRTFLGCLALLACLGLTLGLTAWDPAGLTTWVPAPEKVSRVEITGSYDDGVTLEDPQAVAQVLQVHQTILQQHRQAPGEVADGLFTSSSSHTLRYTLSGGITRQRNYSVDEGTPAWDALRALYSRTEFVLGMPRDQVEALAATITAVRISHRSNGNVLLEKPHQIRSLLNSIAADCDDGTMAQGWTFQTSDILLTIYFYTADSEEAVFSVDICAANIHTLNWARTNQIPFY